ncbi:hypothetical protein P4361_18770 [Fictibacillus sp. B-59209]|uniref:hypothetical protein n=1 Tax=Fictibacillus sp. B-59209 TaxID=3024873 RepID=UPI002E1E7E27|nr:hypothetical protein [Fictibacillus sp. B-59209]
MSPVLMVLFVIVVAHFFKDPTDAMIENTEYSDDYSDVSSAKADASVKEANEDIDTLSNDDTDSASDYSHSTDTVDEDTSSEEYDSTDTIDTSSDDSAMASYTGSDWANLSFDDKFITVQTIIDAMESGGTKVSVDAYWFIDALDKFYGDGNDVTASEKVIDVISMSGVADGVISN